MPHNAQPVHARMAASLRAQPRACPHGCFRQCSARACLLHSVLSPCMMDHLAQLTGMFHLYACHPILLTLGHLHLLLLRDLDDLLGGQELPQVGQQLVDGEDLNDA